MNKFFIVFLGLFLLLPYTKVSAKDDYTNTKKEYSIENTTDKEALKQKDWRISIGTGMLYSPAFLGSDEYQLAILPSIRLQYKEDFFASVEEGIRYYVFNNNGWKVAPIARYQFPRDEEDGGNPFVVSGDDINSLRGLGDVDGTLELGSLFEYDVRKFNIRAEIRQGVNGHQGFIGDFSANLKFPITSPLLPEARRPTIFLVGPRITIVDENYNQAYFDINSIQSINSGLNQFEASGGLLNYGLGSLAIVPVNNNITSTIFLNYNRLAGDAADSPLVQQRGSENQVTAGIFFSYSL